MGRIWQELGEGKYDQNIWDEKLLIKTLKRKGDVMIKGREDDMNFQA